MKSSLLALSCTLSCALASAGAGEDAPSQKRQLRARGAHLLHGFQGDVSALANGNCNITATTYLMIDELGDKDGADVRPTGKEEEYACEDYETGTYMPLDLDKEQIKELEDDMKDGSATPGVTKLDLGKNLKIAANGHLKAAGEHVKVVKDIDPGVNLAEGTGSRSRRGTGEKYFVVFRVTDSAGSVHPDSAETIRENIFYDSVNLKTQMHAISVGQYTVINGAKPGSPDFSDIYSAPGIVEITISGTHASTNGSSSAKTNMLVTAARTKMGGTLTNFMDHAIFVLPRLRVRYAAYAALGGYYQVYHGKYYGDAGVLTHEHGHNLALHHSGGLDGQTYTDHTCIMGNPLFSDDVGKMVFNAPKSWQLQKHPHPVTVINGWYHDDAFIEVDPTNAKSYVMMGIGEYNLQTDPRKPVALKVELGEAEPAVYVGFNSAKGAHADNVQYDDRVTIYTKASPNWGTSSLKAGLSAGGEYSHPDSELVVSARCINTGITPSLACVCIRMTGQTCPYCSCDGAPTTSPPSNIPSVAPTDYPTSSSKPTATHTAAPTGDPTAAWTCRRDKSSSCPSYVRQGWCSRDFWKNYCNASCVCNGNHARCVDYLTGGRCATYAAWGWCTGSQSNYMMRECEKTCDPACKSIAPAGAALKVK